MAVLLGVCNWVHPLLQSPSCCKELKEAGIDAIQLDLGSAEEDFPLSSPGIQRQWKEEAELYGRQLLKSQKLLGRYRNMISQELLFLELTGPCREE